jgi:hypothetical protein
MDTEQLHETSDRMPLFIRGDQPVDVAGSDTTENLTRSRRQL